MVFFKTVRPAVNASNLVRCGFLVLGLLLLWIGLLGWAANVHWKTSWSPARKLDLPGMQFREVMGVGASAGQALKINATGPENNALQSIALKALAAADYPIVRYRFSDFPRSMELTLLFRRADQPEDVQIVALPWPGTGMASYDLRAANEWRGDIIELGFAEFPIGQLVPGKYGFHPFALQEAELWSSSWHGALLALETEWLGYWPWSQRSVHALGRDTETPHAQSLVLILALGITASLVLMRLIGGWRGRRFLILATVLVLGAWLLLDWRWQCTLDWQHSGTKEIYAGKPWSERSRLVADSDVLQAAERIQQVLHEESHTARILISAPSLYELQRLAYHLLPVNVGLLGVALTDPKHLPIPPGTLLAFYNTTEWTFDAKQQALTFSGGQVPVTQLLDTGIVRVYRIRDLP